MKCKTVHNKLIFFLEKELSQTEMSAVQEHLSGCPDCALFSEDLKKTLSILEAQKTPELNPFFYTRVKARLENEKETVFYGTRRPVLAGVVQPVVFIVILLAGIYGGFKLGDTGTDGDQRMLAKQEMIPFWNDLDSEPLENFLMK